jgi:hypothetical protein
LAPTDKALGKSAALTRPAFYSLPPAAALPEAPVPAGNADGRLVLERPDGARLTLSVSQLDAASLSSLCSDFLRG